MAAAAVATTALDVASKVKRPKVKLRPQKTSQKAVVNTMVVVLGINGLKHGLVDKALPPTDYWVRMAFLGFGLAAFQEINPKLGKSMAYLVMVAVVFAQSGKIARTEQLLGELEKDRSLENNFGGGEFPTSLAAIRTTDRQPITLYFERGNTEMTETVLPKRNTPFIDPQRGRRRPAPIPYRGSTVYA